MHVRFFEKTTDECQQHASDSSLSKKRKVSIMHVLHVIFSQATNECQQHVSDASLSRCDTVLSRYHECAQCHIFRKHRTNASSMQSTPPCQMIGCGSKYHACPQWQSFNGNKRTNASIMLATVPSQKQDTAQSVQCCTSQKQRDECQRHASDGSLSQHEIANKVSIMYVVNVTRFKSNERIPAACQRRFLVKNGIP